MGTLTSTNESFPLGGDVGTPAQRLLAVRASTGLSQQAFADALGVSLRAEQNYERGNRKVPAEILLTLAHRFGVDPLWVLQGPEREIRRLASARSIDYDVLFRAIRIVRAAAGRAQRPVSDEDFACWIVAVYQFFEENSDGKGADELIGKLIHGAAS